MIGRTVIGKVVSAAFGNITISTTQRDRKSRVKTDLFGTREHARPSDNQ
ncbi:MAG: hypothetical protein V7603_3720 [Micromonosporaceae bacterium]